uniref:THO complex subunit 7 homolog n=1 Tax=Heterosigma akashiwo TaxID=2829 RepID=A0A7S4D7F4_HETAK
MLSGDDLDAVLHKRLLSKETVFLGTSLTKVSSKFHELVKHLEGVKNEETNESSVIKGALDGVLKELNLYALEMQRGSLIGESHKEELEAYKSQEAKIEEDTIKIQNEIAGLKEELLQEKQVRRRREEYEALARRAAAHPCRAAGAAALAAAHAQVADLARESERLGDILDMRSKQFSTLMASVKDLQATFEEDKKDAKLDTEDDQSETTTKKDTENSAQTSSKKRKKRES